MGGQRVVDRASRDLRDVHPADVLREGVGGVLDDLRAILIACGDSGRDELAHVRDRVPHGTVRRRGGGHAHQPGSGRRRRRPGFPWPGRDHDADDQCRDEQRSNQVFQHPGLGLPVEPIHRGRRSAIAARTADHGAPVDWLVNARWARRSISETQAASTSAWGSPSRLARISAASSARSRGSSCGASRSSRSDASLTTRTVTCQRRRGPGPRRSKARSARTRAVSPNRSSMQTRRF